METDVLYRILTTVLLYTCSAYLPAGNLYHCKQADGNMSFQDRPCNGETLKIESSASGGPLSEEQVIAVVARLTGRDESALDDPKLRQAAEVLVAVDAGKAYAFTKIYGAAEPYCGNQISRALMHYKDKAHDVISLGQYYYSTGLYFQVGTDSVSHSGSELTAALNEMLVEERKKYQYANKIELGKRCKAAVQALRSLTTMYGN
ncbi:hypothetical protein LPB19_12550 [Marinobacter salinisoli]|uniref:DUF4124 domain-containing protein n=1 Tax=Marinobacter salinisoli TaxID=2769486 RepID=A0ABX7MP28_9GAMM|nr:hypothetical protein [Marinobacter salinisoli]QSP94018.1 hypothetical protein LPB19_12550 [Marinobacter salinisoli]